jgi:hypothetical protein
MNGWRMMLQRGMHDANRIPADIKAIAILDAILACLFCECCWDTSAILEACFKRAA